MRIRAAVSAALASAGILLVGWQSGAHVADTGSAAATTSATTSNGTSSGSAAGGGASSGSSGSSSSSGSSGSAGATAQAAGTYAGSLVQTRFGAVQVQITVKAGAITDVTALQLTDEDRKSVQISTRAAPLLRAEVIKAQSAQVQTIGGATVTSAAYLSSLQAALDAANL
ncbi:FMN-binding protein [Arthrobacter sp. PsM3]|uniref:FMN-binding protein n=1 Tax=Arthrobacter sp. PsM3 TaxID=3030531 RepID=UPI00263B09C2|nr:FMN-binding protein [Arthrobacter sp. PsM3]MDN4645789.1 FMN-binding protein [Arthrobacter sp. PsM3]